MAWWYQLSGCQSKCEDWTYCRCYWGKKNPKKQETINIRNAVSKTWKQMNWQEKNKVVFLRNIFIYTGLIAIMAFTVSIWVYLHNISKTVLMQTHTGHTKEHNLSPDKTSKTKRGKPEELSCTSSLWDTASEHCNMAEFMCVTNTRWQLSSNLSACL